MPTVTDMTKGPVVEVSAITRKTMCLALESAGYGVMPHELRTRLNIIMGYTGMLKDGMLGEIKKEQEEALQTVFGRAGEFLNKINEIMQATQIEAGSVTVHHDSLDVCQLLDQLKTDYQLRSDNKKDVALVWDCAPGPMQIITDFTKLKWILQNLIDNALKFTDQGTVTVSVRVPTGAAMQRDSALVNRECAVCNETAPWVVFAVTDTGIGIPEDMHGVIFNEYFQVDTSTTRPYEGLGLGLYIVKNFTDRLGGKIEIKSEPGNGSTFTVTIPSQS